MIYILQNLCSIYDLELFLRFFVSGEGRFLDKDRLAQIFPMRLVTVGEKKTTRRANENDLILTRLDRVGLIVSICPTSILGNMLHFVMRNVIKVIFENLKYDAVSFPPTLVSAIYSEI